MNSLSNVFYLDKDGNLVQLDEILARKRETPVDADVIGGRKYKTAKVGNQVWLAENLDFRWEGLNVGQSTYSKTLDNLPQEAVYYDNDENTYGVNGNTYGMLYNFAAVKYLNDHKDTLIPGWHVPTYEELVQLREFVLEDARQEDPGSFNLTYAGRKLYALDCWTYDIQQYTTAQGTIMTNEPTDSYGFSAVPSGCNYVNTYRNGGTHCWLWSSTQIDSSNAASAYMQGGRFATINGGGNTDVYSKYAVRLIKD